MGILDKIIANLDMWTLIGFFGQGLFMMRFIFQWLASEKARESVLPEIFWYFSLSGGFITLIYALHRGDIVFIVAQALGTIIYVRNIYFVWNKKKKQSV